MEKRQIQINQQRLLTLFEQLISIDSPSYGEREMCDFLKEKLNQLGFSVQEDDAASKIDGNSGNLYGFLDGTLSQPPILLSAHMDTVEPSHQKQMVTHADGTITSNGTTVLGSDDCAGIASILEALTVIWEQNLPHRPVEVIFSAAEEPYCVGIQQFDYARIRSKEAYVFDLSGPVGGAAYQAPMILSFEVIFCGHSAHAGFAPEEGIHAIKAASLAVSQIPCGRIGNTTVNIGTINGGTANNIVPDRCTITGEIRSASDADVYGQLAALTRIARDSAAKFGASVDVKHTEHFRSYCTDLSHPVVQRFQTVCEKLGLPCHLTETFGGSDNNHLSQHGIAGLVVATAMNNCHSCTEYTTETELGHAAALALNLLLAKE